MTRLRNDRGSLPMTMLLIIVSSGLVLVVATVMFGQQRETRNDVERINALNAAQTGLEVALGSIRTATAANGSGNPRALPCALLTGAVSGAGGGATYSARIYYTTVAPPSGDVAWASLATNRWDCGSTATGMPSYALVESTGSAGAGGDTRTLLATYSFTTLTKNDQIAGGVVQAFSEVNSGNYCFSAASTTNPAGSQLLIRLCNPADARQRFAYQAGLTIKLSDITSSSGQALCLDGGASMAVGNPVTFQPCTAAPVARQVWGSDDSSVFYLKPTASTLVCLRSSAGETDGATVSLAAPKQTGLCDPNWTSTATFITAPQFGAGRAGAGTRQLVNSEQFGRCVDVTANDVSSSYLVVFPCKQPLTGAVLWNQNFVLPAVPAGESQASGPIWTTTGGTTYCLRSPGSTAASGNYVTVAACNISGTIPAAMNWVINTATGVHSTSFRIESSYLAPVAGPNTCLSVTNPNAANPDVWVTFNFTISKLVLAACDDTDKQKWNVSGMFEQATLGAIMER